MNLQNKNNIDFSDVNFFDEGDPLADECGPSSTVASALPVIQVEEPGQVALVEEEVAPVAADLPNWVSLCSRARSLLISEACW